MLDPTLATEFALCLLEIFSTTPLVVLIVDADDGDDVGMGNFEVKFCFDEPPTDDSDRVTGWFDAKEVSC